MNKLEKVEANAIAVKSVETHKQREKFMGKFKILEKYKPEESNKFGFNTKPQKEALDLQNKTFDEIRIGKQTLLLVKRKNISEIERGIMLSEKREKARLKKEKMNFYVLDCEMTGKKKPEPVSIAAC